MSLTLLLISEIPNATQVAKFSLSHYFKKISNSLILDYKNYSVHLLNL